MKKIISFCAALCGALVFVAAVSAADTTVKRPSVESVDDPEVYRRDPIDPPSLKVQDAESARVRSAVALPVAAENLIANPSVEESLSGLPAGWSKGGYGSNTRSFAYPVSGVEGGSAISVTVSSYSTGDAKWYFADVPVTPLRTYSFSDYYVANVPSIIVARFKMGDGTYKYRDLSFVDANPGPGFVKTSTEFSVPEGVVSLTIFHLINKTGSLVTDAHSLTDVTPAQEVSLIPNSGFEQGGSDGLPTKWKKGGWGTNNRTYSYPVTSYDGSKGVRVSISSYASGDAKWYFTPFSIPPGVYTYSDNFNSNTASEITVQYQNADDRYSFDNIAQLAKSGSTHTSVSSDLFVPASVKNVTVFHLIRGAGTLSLDNVLLKFKKELTGIFKTGAVTFRFDDGWTSQYENAIPKLNSAGFKGTFYIITRQLFEDGYTGFMSKEQILDIDEQGHEIGAHTRTHAHLAQLSLADQRNEIQGSRDDLIAMGISPVKSFSYPFGEYSSDTIQIVKDAGFTNAASVVDGYATPVSDIYQTERKVIKVNTTISEIRSMIDEAIRDKKWLIFELHEVNDGGGLYSTTPETFNQMVDYVKLKQIPVITLSEGIESY